MNYNTNINWDLFFDQIDLIYNDKPVFVQNFLPDYEKYISWQDVENSLNYYNYRWSIIENSSRINIPEYADSNNKSSQNKSFISHHINQGNTFIIGDFSIHNFLIKGLCQEIENIFPEIACGVNVFGSKTTTTTSSFKPHSDKHPIFVFNIAGECDWTLYKNQSSYLLGHHDLNILVNEKDLSPSLEITLSPGDMLYIPQKVYHLAKPKDTEPYRLSLSVCGFDHKLSSNGQLLSKNMKIDKNHYQI